MAHRANEGQISYTASMGRGKESLFATSGHMISRYGHIW